VGPRNSQRDLDRRERDTRREKLANNERTYSKELQCLIGAINKRLVRDGNALHDVGFLPRVQTKG
jgi:hypothetical protein